MQPGIGSRSSGLRIAFNCHPFVVGSLKFELRVNFRNIVRSIAN